MTFKLSWRHNSVVKAAKLDIAALGLGARLAIRHWFRMMGMPNRLTIIVHAAYRILKSCDQDKPVSKIPNFTAGTTFVVK